jgi:hypothetical protein
MNLDNLKPRIDAFVEFARKFPAPYRSAIVGYLLQLDAAERGVGGAVGVSGVARVTAASPGAGPSVPAAVTGIHPAIAEVANEINASPEAVGRRLVTVTEDRPDIRWKSEDVSRAKRQIEYALVYTYVLEKMGEEGARIPELRSLSVKKRAYDQANFMANFRRQRDWLQLADLPGGKEQEVVLTGAGRQRARQLLANAAENLFPAMSATVGGTVTSASITSPGSEDEDEEQLDLSELDETQEEEVR